MASKRRLAVWSLLLALAVAGPAARADNQEETGAGQEEGEPEETPSPPPVEEPRKPGFWGDRLALYVEALGGMASLDDIDSSITTTTTSFSTNTLSLEDQVFARAALGWALPEGRGTFLAVFQGYKEDKYRFEAEGFQQTTAAGEIPTAPAPWWSLVAENGQLASARLPATWIAGPPQDGGNDLDGDGEADLNELVFGRWDNLDGDNPPRVDPGEVTAGVPDRTVGRPVPESLQNRAQTFDLLFRRGFGGRWINARWTAGTRYFVYDGNVPAAAWLASSLPTEGDGYTDGAGLRLINFVQETRGFGPTGSLEIQLQFFEKRLTLFGQGWTAFLFQDVEADSGTFFTLTLDNTNNTVFPAEARLQESRTKSSWQVGTEVGVRVRLAQGLHLELGYYLRSYQDSILVPVKIEVPTTIDVAAQGTVANYKTRDLLLDGWQAGFSFQF